ncbi:MAG: hypothetical protein UX13_C0030G0001, partial [Candidatus Woesebacteria bacterium GW2011_GWB1_45_5]
MSKELGNNLEYNLDDLFEGNLPEAIDLPELADTPSSVNQFTDGVSGGAIKDGELGGILQSTNFVSGSTGFKLTPSSADIPTTVLTGTLTQTQLNIANRGWVQTSAFSITDADTIAWGAGTFTSADGTAYSIGAGNTGNMSAKTYIYLDTAVSTTAYQTTTTATTAVGAGKVLIAIAQNGTGEASYKVLQGQGGENIDAANIVAGSVTANELSTSITYAGSIIIDTAGLIRSGQTAYDTGTGWFIGNVSGTPKLSIGVGGSITSSLTWDGTNLTVNGYVISGQGTFGGNGSDGALTITSGTTTISASSESVLVKNYTAISITGTGKLDFSTPNTNGTIIILKSQGNITLTSSTSAMIDCSGMGASGGAGVVAGSASNGSVGNGVIFKADYGGGALVGTGGIGGTAIVDSNGNPISTLFAQFLFNLACGGGGGGSTCLAGDIANSGSRGGGALFIQCGKAWNFTTTSGISVAGDAATACVLDSETPGGAGAGGTCMVL